MVFGAHCNGGVKRALDRAAEIGADAVQLFVQSPRAWRFPEHDPADVEAFVERRQQDGIEAVFVHTLYLVNLATSDDAMYEKSVTTMHRTVETACAIEAEGVVVHVGSHLGAGFDAGLERAVPALRSVLELCNDRTWLLLENSAGAGGTIGRSIDELAALFDALDAHPRLGVCLDSCHLFVSGIDVTDRSVLDATLRELDERIGLARLRVLHVNDSKAPLGSNRDRHDNVGAGLIGTKLGVFLSHPKLQKLPAVLETPGPDDHGPDAAEVDRARKLHRRWVAKK
jgi:deoxyribonuclease-4